MHKMFKNIKNGKTNINLLMEVDILVFLFVFAFIILITIILLFSKIKININKFNYLSINPKNKKTDYNIIIQLIILKKFPIFEIKFNKNNIMKIEKIKQKIKNKFETFDFTEIKKNKEVKKKILKIIKKLKIDIDKINLNIEIGTENAVLTSFLIPIVATLVTYILRTNIKNNFIKSEENKFKIKPIYYNQNLLNILFSGIFEIEMIHIINIICILIKKEGVKEYERTSNRRTYGYSYE